MVTSDYGNEIQEDLNAIVGYEEKFNNAIVRHSLDLKDQAIFHNPNPINVSFHDMKKIDLVNPVIGKLETPVKASKLTDYQLTKKLLEQAEVEKLQLRLDALKYRVNNNDDNNENKGSGGSGGGGGDDGKIQVHHHPQNSRIIAQQNEERFQNRQIREREREISNIPKGIFNKRKSSTNFNFPDTPPPHTKKKKKNASKTK